MTALRFLGLRIGCGVDDVPRRRGAHAPTKVVRGRVVNGVVVIVIGGVVIGSVIVATVNVATV